MLKVWLVAVVVCLLGVPAWADNFHEGGYELRLNAAQDHNKTLTLSGRVGNGPECKNLRVKAFVVGSAGDRVFVEDRIKNAGWARKIVRGERTGLSQDQRWKIDQVWVDCLYN